MKIPAAPRLRNLLSNLPLAASAACLLLFYAPFIPLPYAGAIWGVFLATTLFFRISWQMMLREVRLAPKIVAGIWQIMLMYMVFLALHENALLVALSARLGLGLSLLALGVAGLLGVLSAPCMLFVLYLFAHKTGRDESLLLTGPAAEACPRYPTWTVVAVAAASAVLILGIASKSSPLYPFNDWVDANCFMTVGKSILHGKLPYVDLYEQKGPLLYLLHAAACLISDTTFLGVFILEVIAATAFLAIGYRTLCLFVPTPSLLWMPVTGVIVYTAKAFCHGDSAEELCLPLLMYALYVGLRALRTGEAPDSRAHLLIGITSACVLWIKYTMLGFYIGWFIAFTVYFIATKQARRILSQVGMIAAGVIAASLPVLVWLAAKGALGGLWQVYFYDNLFLYSSTDAGASPVAIFHNLFKGISEMMTYHLGGCLLTLLAVLQAVTDRLRPRLPLILCSALVLFLMVFGGGQFPRYYSFVFSIFIPVGLITLVRLVRTATEGLLCAASARRSLRIAGTVAVSLMLCVGTYVLSDNTYLMAYDKEDLPPYRFAEIIQKTEDATLLNYGFLDGGFYMVADVIPSERYFCKLNMENPALTEAQSHAVETGAVDYVVTRNHELDAPLYECVEQADFRFEDTDFTYRLYRRIEG